MKLKYPGFSVGTNIKLGCRQLHPTHGTRIARCTHQLWNSPHWFQYYTRRYVSVDEEGMHEDLALTSVLSPCTSTKPRIQWRSSRVSPRKEMPSVLRTTPE